MARLANPISFTPLPVMVISVAVYAAFFTALIVTHTVVPSAPSHSPKGTNLTEAWGDLQFITSAYHPFNSRYNDKVREYLLTRIDGILHSNGVKYNIEHDLPSGNKSSSTAALHPVTVIDDQAADVTFAGDSGYLSVYFEGNNIIVGIQGTEYGDECYKPSEDSSVAPPDESGSFKKGGVLVNAHFDSVSTGFGATDDGVGVVTVLQLLRYFTTPGNEPKRCMILLLNNGEEDYLNGAKAFLKHPISRYAHTFLNLEGAGAGGRATLFRSTDTEVTRFYKRAKHPFGTVISADGFQLRLVRSQTDYIVFNGDLGLRGLDVAFMEPRAKYHTTQDSARETSMNSLWHMLSGAISTVQGLASDISDEFSGQADSNGKVDCGKGTAGVWFDLFGRAFAVLRLHTLFAMSITLLVFTPVLFTALTIALVRADKWYLFAGKKYIHSPDDDEPVPLNGWRGFFRYPIVAIVTTAALIALAYLYARVNPLIVYGSEWAVWSTMLTAWFVLSWFFLRGADATRPSALQRMYSLIWMYIGAFIILVAVTVAENKYHIAGGYFMVVNFAAISIALFISYLELFALPKKSDYVQSLDSGISDASSRRLLSSGEQRNDEEDDSHEATETTTLLRGDRQSFARYGARRQSINSTEYTGETVLNGQGGAPYGREQGWSGKLPSSLWSLQLILVAPITITLVGQVALILTSALHQTAADGSAVLTVYLAMALLSVIILAPVGPFIHRFTYHVPLFFFLILVGTLIYTLVAFPFSADHRLKVYFMQQVDCETGVNKVSLTGLDPFVRDIVAAIPSSAGQHINCTAPDLQARKGLTKCMWEGIPPKPIPKEPESATALFDAEQKKMKYEETWFDYTVSRTGPNSADFWVQGQNTRSCRLFFNERVSDFHVKGSTSDKRFPVVPEKGATEIRLWHREWDKAWNVSVTWNDKNDNDGKHLDARWRAETNTMEESGLSGRVACIWSDQNENDVIPALEEVKRFMPAWSIVTKLGDGLIEGSKSFSI